MNPFLKCVAVVSFGYTSEILADPLSQVTSIHVNGQIKNFQFKKNENSLGASSGEYGGYGMMVIFSNFKKAAIFCWPLIVIKVLITA